MPVNRSSGTVILCIDDDRDILNLLDKILAGAGHTVIKAENGMQGLVEARNRQPDLILLDVMMPETDGFIVCSQLQANPDTAYIPVVFLSALADEADRTKAFAAGAADYLAKPVQKESLLAKVEEQLKTRRRWQDWKEAVVFWDEKVQPATFSEFKKSLAGRLDLSREIRERLVRTSPLDIYNVCDSLAISQGQMTSWMADFLFFPLVSMIDPATLLLGILPLSFARENHVVAMNDEKTGRSFILSNPFDWMLLDTLKKFFGLQRDTVLRLAEPDQIDLLFGQPGEVPAPMTAVRAERPREVPAGPAEKTSLEDLEARPIVAIANNILASAVSERASDIHIEPKVDNTVIRFRIDGDMRDVSTLGKTTGVMLISRFKAIAGLDITEKRKPQDGAVEAMIAGKIFKLRLATTSTPGGESLIMRLLEPGVKAKDLQSLGMTENQVRSMIGFAGRHFLLYKFRTLPMAALATSDRQWTAAPADRWGRFLRETGLDELPQLWNVLRGDMSLVGPRPERPYFAAQFLRELPAYSRRHHLAAGMTGWAQVHGWRGNTSIMRRVEYDLYYLRHWSLGLDFRILWMTLRDFARRLRHSLSATPGGRDDGSI